MTAHSPASREVAEDRGEQVARAVIDGLRSTAARPQTRAEVTARLRGRGVPDDVAEEAVAQLEAAGAVDDVAFARLWVDDRGHARGFGAARLRQELRRRQVPEPVIDDALAPLEARDDVAVATELARQRVRQLPAGVAPETVARRLHSYLVRRGHPPALAQRVAIEVAGLNRVWD